MCSSLFDRPGIPQLVGIAQTLVDLEEEPLTALGLIDDRFKFAGRGIILVFVTHFVRGSLQFGNMRVIVHQTAYHLTGGNKGLVVVLDGLQLMNVADAAHRRSTDTSYTLGQYIDCLEHLVGVLIEQQMVITEVRARQVPVKVFNFDI
jgi:hypothetical protein